MSEWSAAGVSIAQNYEQYLVPRIFGPIGADFLDIMAVKPGERVLDVACGTGAVTRQAAQRVEAAGRVAGLDMLPDMLEQARSVAADMPIDWRQGTADAMPFGDEEFDVVLCQHGIQFFPDKAAALREMRRVLAPHGRIGVLALNDISGTPPLTALADALTGNIGPAPAQFVRMVGAMSDESQLVALVEDAGFRDVQVEHFVKEIEFPSPEEFVRQYLISTPLAANPAVAQADEGVRTRIESEVRSRLAPYEIADGWRVPSKNYVVIARK